MHDGTSEMMMKFTALGVVDNETEHVAKESGETSLSQTKRKGTKGKEQHTTTTKKPRRNIRIPYTVDSNEFLLMRLKVLMLNQNLR